MALVFQNAIKTVRIVVSLTIGNNKLSIARCIRYFCDLWEIISKVNGLQIKVRTDTLLRDVLILFSHRAGTSLSCEAGTSCLQCTPFRCTPVFRGSALTPFFLHPLQGLADASCPMHAYRLNHITTVPSGKAGYKQISWLTLILDKATVCFA